MKRALTIFLLLVTLSAWADERGEKRLERISRHYSALGNYSLSFILRAGEGVQQGELMVEGNNSYIKVADTEVYVVDSLRYEVRGASKEIIVDRADAYEKELLNPLNGFAGVKNDYNIEECEVDGRTAVRLTPKRTGETIYIVTAPDGESISKVKYGVGENSAEVEVNRLQGVPSPMPKFSKEQYKGFELIDFR
ncbi:MAG: hypothetical protein E7129_05530 [Rikenellaceae bacterium]|nr:hypothetical protein [Rikenellaceae bacterium]